MKMSDSIANLAAAMAKAQASMGGAHKDSTNPHFKSKYADLSSVVDAIKPCLTENGLSYLQFVRTCEEGVGVETLLSHSSGEYILADPFYVPVEKRNAHGFGSALTYARRYSLAAVCGLKADDDDGNAAAEAAPKRDVAAAVVASASGADVNKEAFDSLVLPIQEQLRSAAREVLAVHKESFDGDPLALANWVEAQHMNDEEKMGLWSLLPANVRRAIKDSQRAAQAAKGKVAA